MAVNIRKLNSNLPAAERIATLNDFILILEGKVAQGKFDKNELDELYTALGITRDYTRNQGLGNTTSNYTDWSHVQAESGYSIWKCAVSSYTHNALNEVYIDGKLFELRGAATAETATAFDVVKHYNGDSVVGYTDNTSEAASEGGTEFEVNDSTNDYVYIGDAATFTGAKFEWQTRGSNYTLVVEYYNGSSWTTMTANTNNLDDDTSSFESDGKISFDAPGDWATVDVDGDTKYWIRISSSTTPVTTAKAYLVIPYASVIGLLAMSATQLLNEDWAWCYYSNSVYITLPNSGSASAEGNKYITSSSSSTNLENYFVHNHQITANYKSSSTSGNFTDFGSAASGDIVYINAANTVDQANATDDTKVGIGVYNGSGVRITGIITNVNTVGNGDIVANDLIFLSTTAGKVTKTPPASSGNVVQLIGRALTAEASGDVVDIVLNIDMNPFTV